LYEKIFIFALLLTACASPHYKPDQSTMSQFKQGSSTYNDVVSRLGNPISTTVDSDGLKTIIYYDSSVKVDPLTAVPIVGLFAGGASSEIKMLSFLFKNEILQKMNYTESASHVNSMGQQK
jgi:hypothetical protein